MKNSTQKVLLALGFAGTLLSGLMASNVQFIYTDITTRKEFTNVDQRSGKFVSLGKPFLVKHNPSLDELDLIYCAWYDEKDGSIKQHTTSIDLEKIVPTRWTAKFVDTGVKIDRIGEGYRDTYTEQIIEKLLKTVKIYPDLTYNGTFLVDEYVEILPMKWIFTTIEDFRAIKNYLVKKFAMKSISIPQEKPLLLVDFIEKNQSFNDDDITFLNTYYAVLNPEDQAVKKFFLDIKLAMNIAREDTVNAKAILESPGEAFIRQIEDKFGSLKTKDLFIKFVVLSGSIWAFWKLMDLCKASTKAPARAPAPTPVYIVAAPAPAAVATA